LRTGSHTWLTSYSLYHESLAEYFRTEVSEEWEGLRQESMRILQQEAELKEIARLVGTDALSDRDRLMLATAKSLREDFLHQNAFDDVDTYTSFPKQFKMLSNIIGFDRLSRDALEQGVTTEELFALPVQENLVRSRYIPESQMDEFDAIWGRIEQQVRELVEKRVGAEEVAA
jgi:V/A-type H+-transporting ATPase subunit A